MIFKKLLLSVSVMLLVMKGQFSFGSELKERASNLMRKCKYNGKNFPTGTLIATTTDGCAMAILYCKKFGRKAKIVQLALNTCECPICPFCPPPTPPPVNTTFLLIEGNETVVQKNSFQNSTGILVMTVPSHKNYTQSEFLLHQDTKTSMVKSNNTCQLADLRLPGDIEVADVVRAFETNAEMNHTTTFFLKARESRMGFEERKKLLPDVQGLCEKTQLVKTQDFEVNQTEFEKYKMGEVIFFNNPKSTRKCLAKLACSTVGPRACGNMAFVPPGKIRGFSFHQVSDGSVCVKCNIIDDLPGYPPCVNPEFCNCSDIIGKESLYDCSIKSGVNTTIQINHVNGSRSMDNVVQQMIYNKNTDKRSLTFISPAHKDLKTLEIVMHARSDGYWHSRYLKNNHLMKIGTDCHVSTLPDQVFPYKIAIGIQEIKAGNDVTTEDDELDNHKILLDAGYLTEPEANALHPDIKSRCSDSPPKKLVEAPVTKNQSDDLRNRKIIFLNSKSRGLCELQKAATTENGNSGCMRWPNPDGNELWLHEIVHSVIELTCCVSSEEFPTCCEENHPLFCQCKNIVDKQTFNQCRKDKTPALFVATGYGSTYLGSAEILTREISGNYTSRLVHIGGKCAEVSDFPIETTLATGALFNDLPHICVGYKQGDTSKECFGLKTDGSWENDFNLTKPLAYGGSSVAFGEWKIVETPWWIVGGDPSGKGTEVWGGQPPAEISNGTIQLPNTINSQPCMTKINDHEAFVTAIPTDEWTNTNFAWIFNIQDNTWTRLNDTLQERSGAACGFIKTDSGRFVVLAGGYKLNTTEILNLDTLGWAMGPNFKGNMMGGRMVSVGDDEELILIGGFDSEDSTVSTDIRRMNSSMNSWETVGELNTPRFNAVALAVLAGDLPPLCPEQ